MSTSTHSGGSGEPTPRQRVHTASISYVRYRYERANEYVRRDLRDLRQLPGGPWSAVLATVAIAVIFNLIRVGVTDLYTESVVFLVLAVAVGLLSGVLGVLLVVLSGVFDFAHFVQFGFGGFTIESALTYQPWDTLGLIAGRLVTYVLLFVLVVSLPRLQRRTNERATGFIRERWSLGKRGVTAFVAAASAVILGGSVYLWTVIAPYLIRDGFTFAPTVEAIQSLQAQGGYVAVAAAIIAFVISTAYHREADTSSVRLSFSDFYPTGRMSGAFGWVRRAVRYAFVIFVLMGLVSGLLDVALILSALVAADVLVPKLLATSRLTNAIARVPRAVRFAAAFVATMAIAQLIFMVYYQPLMGSEFFPVVLSFAVGVVIFSVLGGTDARGSREDSSNYNGVTQQHVD